MHQETLNYLYSEVGSAWHGHGPFAVWLPEYLGAKLIVDLGVDNGFSTFCFAIGTSETVIGLDSFEGDPHAGFRNTESYVHEKLIFLKENYKLPGNVEFIKGFFHDIAQAWTRGKVDLLHIDGFHSYEAVSQDFADWFPHCQEEAIVIFHDTLSFPDTVGKFFDELAYPKFNFLHTHGLGVICKNKEKLSQLYADIGGDFGPVSELTHCD